MLRHILLSLVLVPLKRQCQRETLLNLTSSYSFSGGCCEPLDRKLDLLIQKIPRLRWVSVSPLCDREMAAEKVGEEVGMSFERYSGVGV